MQDASKWKPLTQLDLTRRSRVTSSWLGRSSRLPSQMKYHLPLVPHSPLFLSQMASSGASGSLGNMNSCACKATCALLCDCVCLCTECKTTCGLQGAAPMSPLLSFQWQMPGVSGAQWRR